MFRLAVLGAVALSLLAVPATAFADDPLAALATQPTFTVAGTGNPGATLDRRFVGSPASSLGFDTQRVVPTPDGGYLILTGELVKVAPNGRVAAVLPAPVSEPFVDAIEQPDGSFIATVELNGDGRVWRIDPAGHAAVVAGSARPGFSGDGGPATAARLSNPTYLAALPGGGFLVSDSGNERVRRVGPDGVIETVAGNGQTGAATDGAVATQTPVPPGPLEATQDGGFLVASHGLLRVRPDGTVTRVAGNGQDPPIPRRPLPEGDDGPATARPLFVHDFGLDAAGGVFIAGSGAVSRVAPDGSLHTLNAGTRPSYFDGDGLPLGAISAGTEPLALLRDGSLLLGQQEGDLGGPTDDRIRMIPAPGTTRLAVALTRESLRQRGGRLVAHFLTTVPASVQLTVYRGDVASGRALGKASVAASSGAGQAPIPVSKKLTAGDPYVIAATATTADGQIATDRLVVIAGGRLSVKTGRLATEKTFVTTTTDEYSARRCRAFGRARVDCQTYDAVNGHRARCSGMQTVLIEADGSLALRDYRGCRFIKRPHFQGPARPATRLDQTVEGAPG